MVNFIFPLIVTFVLFCSQLEPAPLPSHPLYTHYAYTFSEDEKSIIIHHAKKAKNNINDYYWPTDTLSPKVNNFFRILNKKSYDHQYNKAILFLLNLFPTLIDTSKESC